LELASIENGCKAFIFPLLLHENIGMTGIFIKLALFARQNGVLGTKYSHVTKLHAVTFMGLAQRMQ
jgi:hypothetical protein